MRNETERLIPESMYASAMCRALARIIDVFLVVFLIIGIYAIVALLHKEILALGLNDILDHINKEIIFGYYSIFSIISPVIIYILYVVILQTSRHQATYGMRLLSIQIIGENLDMISKKRALGRLVICIIFNIVPAIYPTIAFFMITFSKKKQAPHDILSGTYVIYKYAQSSNGKVQLLETIKTPVT